MEADYSQTQDIDTIAASVRHSDNHTMLSARRREAGPPVTYTRRFYDVSNGLTVTKVTDVFTDSEQHTLPTAAMLLDRHDIVYICYSGIDGTPGVIGYNQSLDGGTSWGTEGRLDEDTASGQPLGLSIVEAISGGRVYGVWAVGGDEIWGSYITSFLLQIWPGTVELDIDGYEPYFGGSGLDLRLRLRANSWRTEIKTGAKVLATAGYTGTAVTVSMVEFHIEVQGTIYGVHEAHAVVSGAEHIVDARDLEEAALLWNREGLRRKPRLALEIPGGRREYSGVISGLRLWQVAGEPTTYFALRFQPLWNVSKPLWRGWT